MQKGVGDMKVWLVFDFYNSGGYWFKDLEIIFDSQEKAEEYIKRKKEMGYGKYICEMHTVS